MRVIRDEFLTTYPSLREHANTVDFTGHVLDEDGKLYPDVSVDIPREVQIEVKEKLEDLLGPVDIKLMFMRLTTEDTEGAPHQAHTDTILGEFSLMLYLTGKGGTSFVQHKATGMRTDPETPEEFAAWEADTNRPWAWQVWAMTKARENRACIFPAVLMHRAEPVGGFGKNAEDGRLVLTAFFDLKENTHESA